MHGVFFFNLRLAIHDFLQFLLILLAKCCEYVHLFQRPLNFKTLGAGGVAVFTIFRTERICLIFLFFLLTANVGVYGSLTFLDSMTPLLDFNSSAVSAITSSFSKSLSYLSLHMLHL